MDRSKPNILMITCHDLGDYIGCYGTPVSTPNLDRLAVEGVLFEQHFAAATVCSPSRGSLWTGCYAHTHGLMGLVPRGWELDVDTCPHAAKILREAGYETHLFGLQHEHWDSKKLGYEYVHKVRSTYCEDVTPVVIDYLHESRKNNSPFFASIGFFEVHRIGSASQGPMKEFLGQLPSHFQRDVYQPDDPEEVEVRPYLFDSEGLRAELADFYGAIKFMDESIGEILTALDEEKLSENTLVIFTSDHGASFLHSKGTLFDGGVKVPLVLRLPGTIPAGKRISGQVSNIDVLPTILDLIGAPIPAHIQGQSVAEIVMEKESTGRDFVFAEKNYTVYFDPARMARSDRYKYIRNGLRKGFFDFIIAEIEMGQASFRNNLDIFKFYDSRRVFEELYDLEEDPGEMNNLATNEHYASVLNEMRAVLMEHLEKTNDPFREFHNDILMPEDVYPDVKGIRGN